MNGPETLAARPYLYVGRELTSFDGATIAEAMNTAFSTLFSFIGKAGLAPVGPPMTIYPEMPGTEMRFRCAIEIGQSGSGVAGGEVEAGVIPGGRAVMRLHNGAYANLHKSHQALWKDIEDAGLEPDMPIWEVYLDDPQRVPEEKLRTEVWRAVK